MDEKKLNKKKGEAAKVLELMGLLPNVKGYPYTITAITLCLERMDRLQNITTDLYPRVAEIYGAKPHQVERAIRYAIELIWNRGNPDILKERYGQELTLFKGKNRPTNAQFISFLVTKIADN
ncbi:MAG: sporulation initiation factor Spo0A C-terminal domain-containing protein [Defluviitaleaceae bacterium]|nr:sporulation initiation factor Spo0A C-terminal domain-containing protein [Defluviitaleaceae bacterium]